MIDKKLSEFNEIQNTHELFEGYVPVLKKHSDGNYINSKVEFSRLLIDDLFDFKLSDHILTNTSWVESNQFTWLSGDVYVSAYDTLVHAKSLGNTVHDDVLDITYFESDLGFKICDATQLDILNAIYEQEGQAWYYVLDEENRRFKLPRSNNFIRVGAQNVTIDNQLCNTPLFLYFYVGNVVKNELSIDVANLANQLNSKVDIDMSNVPFVPAEWKLELLSLSAPDFSKGVAIPNGYVTPKDGYVQSYWQKGNQSSSSISANNIVIAYSSTAGSNYGTSSGACFARVGKNVVITYSNVGTVFFFPCQGAA